MVDSKQKGARAENAAKDILIKYTKLNWQRIPLSGALDAKHGLKGDLYIPNVNNVFCIEVKHYADDKITSKILTDKESQLQKWWLQTIREADEINKIPLLIFKFDRSKWFVGFNNHAITNSYSSQLNMPKTTYRWLEYNWNVNFKPGILKDAPFFIAKLEDWLVKENPEFINE
jgi:hypothetical protein